MDLPWDFTVVGVPVSVQSKNTRRKQKWKSDVASAARNAWPAEQPPPIVDRVQLTITFFHDAAPLDVDNMLKPIQDALIGIVYEDDNQVLDVHGHVRDVNNSYRIRGLSPEQARGFTSGHPFVNVRVDYPGDEEALP